MEAAALALRFYQEIRAKGWTETLRQREAIRCGQKIINVTIGEYIDAVTSRSLLHPKTLESYAAALRKIAADIHQIPHNGRSNCMGFKGEFRQWEHLLIARPIH
jgi:hypothetical protein